MERGDNMFKRIFLMSIVIQIFFLGQCYASLDRLADVGAEVLRERIVGSTAFRVSEFRINELTGGLKKSNPGVIDYSFYIINDVDDNAVRVAVFVNQEGYIDSIVVNGSVASESKRVFISRMLAETMRAIGLSKDDMLSLCSNEVCGRVYTGEVYSENMNRKVYLSYWAEKNGAGIIQVIDRIPLAERDMMDRAN